MSFIMLELDTTPPKININAQGSSVRDSKNIFIIQSDELLSINSSIYFVDSQNNKHEANFKHNGDEFLGEVYFNSFPLGKTKIYIEAIDDVGNSALYVKEFSLLKENYFKMVLSISDFKQEINKKSPSQKIENNMLKQNIKNNAFKQRWVMEDV